MNPAIILFVVFFVTLAVGIPFTWSMLHMFGFSNIKLIITITLICYLICTLIYILVYKTTSYSYYQIVSNEKY